MTQSEFVNPKKAMQPVEHPEAMSATNQNIVDFSDLLDQIDSVLEKNAEEFVNNFVQKGGE